MSKTVKGNMMIAQSGGPTVVINQSLIGAVLEAKGQKTVGRIYGARHGIKGILEEDFVDLRKERAANLAAVGATPSSALGTVRQKPTADDCVRMFEIMKRHGVRYFFYIGGNDSAETAHIVDDAAAQSGYELGCFHIPKTIDNDLRENDHTPGYGSAAKFVACALMGDNLDNRALPGVKIDVIMGRDAGFLTAASVLGKQYDDDGPHLVYLPERPFDVDRFVGDVEKVYAKLGRCVVAVSEGLRDEGGHALAASAAMDGFNKEQFSGTGALGDLLSEVIKKSTKIPRVRADTFGYLQRSFPFVTSEVDAREAREVGAVAVRHAVAGEDNGSIAIKRKSTKRYGVYYERVALRKVARDTRDVPPRFINRASNGVTQAFLDYAMPLVGRLPKMGRLKDYRF